VPMSLPSTLDPLERVLTHATTTTSRIDCHERSHAGIRPKTTIRFHAPRSLVGTGRFGRTPLVSQTHGRTAPYRPASAAGRSAPGLRGRA
jgi:hypothetical protein